MLQKGCEDLPWNKRSKDLEGHLWQHLTSYGMLHLFSLSSHSSFQMGYKFKWQTRLIRIENLQTSYLWDGSAPITALWIAQLSNSQPLLPCGNEDFCLWDFGWRQELCKHLQNAQASDRDVYKTEAVTAFLNQFPVTPISPLPPPTSSSHSLLCGQNQTSAHHVPDELAYDSH